METMDSIDSIDAVICYGHTGSLIGWLQVVGAKHRVLLGAHEKPINIGERFLSCIRFDSREKVQDLIGKVGS